MAIVQSAPPSRIEKILGDAAQTFAGRNPSYGEAYRKFGPLVAALFPHGFPKDADEAFYTRLGVFLMICGKMTRLAPTLTHQDSAHDMVVYSAMLQSLIEEHK